MEKLIIPEGIANASKYLSADEFKEFYTLLFEWFYNDVEPNKTNNQLIDVLICSIRPYIEYKRKGLDYEEEMYKDYLIWQQVTKDMEDDKDGWVC